MLSGVLFEEMIVGCVFKVSYRLKKRVGLRFGEIWFEGRIIGRIMGEIWP